MFLRKRLFLGVVLSVAIPTVVLIYFNGTVFTNPKISWEVTGFTAGSFHRHKLVAGGRKVVQNSSRTMLMNRAGGNIRDMAGSAWTDDRENNVGTESTQLSQSMMEQYTQTAENKNSLSQPGVKSRSSKGVAGSAVSTSAPKLTQASAYTASDGSNRMLSLPNNTHFKPLSLFKSPWHSGIEGEELGATKWVNELKTFLLTVKPGLPITLISSEYNFRHALLNWLVGALVRCQPPVDNVLVLTYDSKLLSVLYLRLIPYLLIPLESLVKDKMYWRGNRQHMSFLLVVRVVVMRLLNYWGYDVANYDADAIILKNPKVIHEMYADSDLIGQYGGSMPKSLLSEWGFVMCMGAVILMRSTMSVGKLVCQHKLDLTIMIIPLLS